MPCIIPRVRSLQKGNKKSPNPVGLRDSLDRGLEGQSQHDPLSYVDCERASGHGHGVRGYGKGD
jgi:hypothetical protein